MKFDRNILITGGAGFIGSCVVQFMVKKYPNYRIINLDKLTYAGNLENLVSVEGESNYEFVKGDILDQPLVESIMRDKQVDGVLHLAAESHVDRSITNPDEFVMTNVLGTLTMLNAAKAVWNGDFDNKLFYHISTDEVYGSLGETGAFTEDTPYDPKSPYSASKASSDHMVRAYFNTYDFPIVISNCSNNYGPFQFPEKLIPLAINNLKTGKPIPIYGEGLNIRDWLYVEDHARAIDMIFHNGKPGETYNVGGHNEWKNIDLINLLCDIMDRKLGKEDGACRSEITYVADRLGHDMRYAVDSSKLSGELGWEAKENFRERLEETIDWYLENESWLENVTSGDYAKYYEEKYG
ncbi:MAG: dTDP-glucose 4,6-dehydratase [Flavobacteriales bacterium]|nr:dTDP-glucose 4,6-dehydratase [Flavobacteriales bacterium]